MKKLLLLCALFVSMTAFAQEEKKEEIVVPETETAFRNATEFSSYGYANRAPLALIQAAQIVIENNFVPGDMNKASDATDSKVADKETGNAVILDVDQLLADAREMADGDKNVLALITKVEKSSKAKRGATGGAIYHVDRVLAHTTDTYSIVFNGGTVSTVTISGDGDTDLDLYVYDMNGNFICGDSSYGDYASVSFIAYYTTTFYVKVVNRGGVYNQYVLRTN